MSNVVDSLLRPTALKRMVFFISFDILLSLLTLYLAYALRFNFTIPVVFLDSFWLTFGVLFLLKVIFLFLFRNYSIVWRFFSFVDAQNVMKAHLFAYGSFVLIYLLFADSFAPFPRSVIAIDFFLSLFFFAVLRMSRRMVLERETIQQDKPTLIIGINSKTTTIIQSALKGDIGYYPVGIVSYQENHLMQDSYIQNIRVYAPEAMEKVVRSKGIVAAILTEEIGQEALQNLANQLISYGVYEIKKIKILGAQNEKLEDLSIEDLLARHPQDLDVDSIERFVVGQRVLITGAGGSIGSEIARQCQKFGAKQLTLVDNSEFNLYQIGEQLKGRELQLLDVTQKALLDKLLQRVRPTLVIHAAAYKHVPICEHNQEVAVRNNVLGTKNVIDSSIAYGVQKVVIVSTDKAVRPTNVMGATKRVTELYANNVEAKETEIVAVRFGNVLGSSGSVIPKFKSQIEAGGPVTVTHPEITRYFMLIPEACQLVLQTASIAKGGELFILDMGEPVKILELAKRMIQLYDKEDEVEIVFSGLRPGEKLYEELLLDTSEQKTKYRSIFIAKPTLYDLAQLQEDIALLLSTEDKVKVLQKIVPEFTREDSL